MRFVVASNEVSAVDASWSSSEREFPTLFRTHPLPFEQPHQFLPFARKDNGTQTTNALRQDVLVSTTEHQRIFPWNSKWQRWSQAYKIENTSPPSLLSTTKTSTSPYSNSNSQEFENPPKFFRVEFLRSRMTDLTNDVGIVVCLIFVLVVSSCGRLSSPGSLNISSKISSWNFNDQLRKQTKMDLRKEKGMMQEKCSDWCYFVRQVLLWCHSIHEQEAFHMAPASFGNSGVLASRGFLVKETSR